jgi:hypothetical protein
MTPVRSQVPDGTDRHAAAGPVPFFAIEVIDDSLLRRLA